MSQKLIQVKLDNGLVEAVNEAIKEYNQNPLIKKVSKTSIITDALISFVNRKNKNESNLQNN